MQTKKEVIEEIGVKDLATKKDLLELKLELQKDIHSAVSGAKWQVIGAVAAMLFIGLTLKHFGF